MTNRITVEGPAVVIRGGYTYYTEGTITVTPVQELRDIQSSIFGRVDRRPTDRMFSVEFTPNGMLDSMAAYWPYTSTPLGATVAPSPDVDTTILSMAGEQILLKASIITQCPQLLLGVDKGPFGPMTITAMGTLAKSAATDQSMYILQQAQNMAHTLDLGKILTPGYKASIREGVAEVAAFDAEEGFTFDFGATLAPRKVNAYGTVNFKLTDLQPQLTFRPYGLTSQQALEYLRMQGTGAAMLGSSTSLGKSLVVTPVAGNGITLVFHNFQVSQSALTFGFTDPRHADWTVTPVLEFSGGVAQPLFDVVFPTFN